MIPTGAYYAAAAVAALYIWARSRQDDQAELPPDDDWWDEEDLTFEEEPEPVGTPGGIGSPGSTATTIPNISGNPAGYNVAVWSSPLEVQKVLFALGYQSTDPLNTAPSTSAVKAFQRDYNTASELSFQDAVGQLTVDGIVGKNTLNAMERVTFGFDGPNPQDYQRWANWKTEFGLW